MVFNDKVDDSMKRKLNNYWALNITLYILYQ